MFGFAANIFDLFVGRYIFFSKVKSKAGLWTSMLIIEILFVFAVLFANEPVDLLILPGKYINVCH